MDLYNQADQLYHFLSQPIAKINRAFVPSKEDDSHTNLYFDPATQRIMGRWIPHQPGDICFAINITTMQYEWIDRSLKLIKTISAVGQGLRNTEDHIISSLVELGLSPEAFRERLHYNIPDYGFHEQDISLPQKGGRIEWIHYRSLANLACTQFLTFFQTKAEVRIWPHHFDTGVYFQPTSSLGLGLGLAMQDEMIRAPYFYMSGYLKANKLNYRNLPDLGIGRWIVLPSWQGAVLPLDDLQKFTYGDQQHHVQEFMKLASHWLMQQS